MLKECKFPSYRFYYGEDCSESEVSILFGCSRKGIYLHEYIDTAINSGTATDFMLDFDFY